MNSSIWRPSPVGAPGGKEISVHNFEELAALHAVARLLAQPGEFRDQIEHALQEMGDRLGMQRGMISLLDRETGEAWLDVAHGVDIQGRDVTYLPGEGITGKVAQTGRAAVIPRISEEPMFLNRTGARRVLRKQDISFICVPIKQGKNVFGTLSVDRLFTEEIALDEDVRLLSIIASIIFESVLIPIPGYAFRVIWRGREE